MVLLTHTPVRGWYGKDTTQQKVTARQHPVLAGRSAILVKGMEHLAFFYNFTIPPPSPHTM